VKRVVGSVAILILLILFIPILPPFSFFASASPDTYYFTTGTTTESACTYNEAFSTTQGASAATHTLSDTQSACWYDTTTDKDFSSGDWSAILDLALSGVGSVVYDVYIEIWNVTSDSVSSTIGSWVDQSTVGDDVTYTQSGVSAQNLNPDEVIRVRILKTGGTVDLVVSYNGDSTSADSRLVTPAQASNNTAPVIDPNDPSDNEATHNVTYSIEWNATDADNDALTWSLSTNATGMAIEYSNWTAWTNWTPSYSQSEQSYYVNVSVSDGTDSDYTNYTLYVNNTAPVVDSVSDAEIWEQDVYSQRVNATDTNGDVLTWSCSCPSWLSLESSGNSAWVNGTAERSGTYSVTVTADDGYDTDSSSWTITVLTVEAGGTYTPMQVQFKSKQIDFWSQTYKIEFSANKEFTLCQWEFRGKFYDSCEPIYVELPFNGYAEYGLKLHIVDNAGQRTTHEYVVVQDNRLQVTIFIIALTLLVIAVITRARIKARIRRVWR